MTEKSEPTVYEGLEAWMDAQDLVLPPWQRRILQDFYESEIEDVDLGDITLPRYDVKELLVVGAGTLGLLALAGVCGYIGYGLVQLLRVVR